MKSSIFVIIVFLVGLGTTSAAQCTPDEHTSACIPMLSDGFNFLKSYKIDGKDGSKTKIEYSYVFTKGTQYMLNLCTPSGGSDGIVIDLYDSRRKKVGSSQHKGENLAAFVYPCNTTGIYYITYTLDDSADYCGGSALGFKK